MSFEQDPNENAQISGSDFAQMCDEMKRLRIELTAVTADLAFRRELGALQQREYDKVTDERDALKADLCAFAVDMEKQLSASQQREAGLRKLIEVLECPNCKGVGWYMQYVRDAEELEKIECQICADIAALSASTGSDFVRREKVQQKYNELIMGVATKYEGESRHETALRYIKERENAVYPVAARDLEQRLAERTEERDKLIEMRSYCMGILREAGHDEAAPIEALVRSSIAYASRMESDRDTAQTELAAAMQLQAELQSALQWAKEEIAAVTAERDALKAKLATINHIAMSLFVRSTSSEVTGEMSEIGRLSR